MKHNLKVTIILILMFFITQMIGIFVIHTYNQGLTIPYGMEPPKDVEPNSSLISLIFAFPIAILLFFLLTRLKAEKVIKLWFFFVTVVAIGLGLKAFFYFFYKKEILFQNTVPILRSISPEISLLTIIVSVFAFILAYYKIFKRNLWVHNLTELLIYPGIAVIFVPLLNMTGVIILLLLISFYDIWAVWKSGFMQNLAKYQINNLKIFTGFFIPYANKKEREKIKNIKQKYKEKSDKFLEQKFKKANIRVNLAILGGGDVIFPIIAAGVFYAIYHSVIGAIIISITSTISLLFLFIFAKKGQFYPAMPFLTIGIYIGVVIDWILLYLHLI